MPKKKQPLQQLLGPVPAALIGCGNGKEINIITLAWVGVVNSSPPLISAAIRPNRYSYEIICDTGEFTVNLPKTEQVELTDGCGTLSGRDLDKFKHFGLTPIKSTLNHAPMIAECPISMECRVEHKLDLGSHTLFIGQVVSTFVDEDILDDKGKINFNSFNMLGFCAGSYLGANSLGPTIGFTVKE